MVTNESAGSQSRNALTDQEKHDLKRTLVTVLILVVASSFVVDLVGDVLEQDNVIKGRFTWSVVCQVVILGVALAKLFRVMDLSRRWTAEALLNLLGDRVRPGEDILVSKAADHLVRLVYLVVLYQLVFPPMSILLGGKIVKLLKLGVVFLGLFLGYQIWASVDKMSFSKRKREPSEGVAPDGTGKPSEAEAKPGRPVVPSSRQGAAPVHEQDASTQSNGGPDAL